MKPVVIVIGGTDSSGGAGISRDIATLAELECEARPVVTAVTAQTDMAVHAVTAISPDHVAQQLSSALATGPVGAIKTGMLHSGETVVAVAEVLTDYAAIPLVIDPVLVSSSGTPLLGPDGIAAIKTHLLPLCALVTPNLPEARMLTGSEHPEQQAKILLELGAAAVLVKGGHGDGEMSIDRLFQNSRLTVEIAAPRLNASLRGTGCMLASAAAANLSLGHSRERACSMAKDFVGQKLQQAASYVCLVAISLSELRVAYPGVGQRFLPEYREMILVRFLQQGRWRGIAVIRPIVAPPSARRSEQGREFAVDLQVPGQILCIICVWRHMQGHLLAPSPFEAEEGVALVVTPVSNR